MLANAERSEAGADTLSMEWRIARVRRCGLVAGSFIFVLIFDITIVLLHSIYCFDQYLNIFAVVDYMGMT